MLPNPHPIHTTPGLATCHSNSEALFCNQYGHYYGFFSHIFDAVYFSFICSCLYSVDFCFTIN